MTGGLSGDTIFALSTGALPSAIAIIRVSGPDAGHALEAMVGTLPPPRMATYRSVRDAAGMVLDRALVLWFPGHRTATGEPLGELHLHGGRAVVMLVGAALAACGLRPAEPGEFTRRAFLNGRMDLTAAEGLADLLEAETRADHARALRMSEGGLGRIIEGWRTTVLDLAASVESAIEFGETDDDVPALPAGVTSGLQALSEEVADMLRRPPAERLRDGLRVVIAGPPNLGKSSLLNALAGRDVALTTPVPGTTRDVIEAPVRIGDHAILLIDTAGLREAEDSVEQLGVEKARRVLIDADLILWCGEPADCPAPDRSIMLWTRADERPVADDDRLPVSIREPATLALLRRNIGERAALLNGRIGEVLLNYRQRSATLRLSDALEAASLSPDLVLLADDLRAALRCIDELVGRTGTEDMLDALFARFCIGK